MYNIIMRGAPSKGPLKVPMNLHARRISASALGVLSNFQTTLTPNQERFYKYRSVIKQTETIC